MTSLLEDFAKAVAQYPEKIAIVDGAGQATTFQELDNRAKSLAAAWHSKGIGPGDRVLLARRVDAELYASLAALWHLGATVVLPEPAMGLNGLRHAARTTGVAAFCSSGWFGLLRYILPELWGTRHLRPRGADTTDTTNAATVADDVALISFTSGTTGAPKAIPRSHGFLQAQHKAVAPLLHSPTAERDLVAFPVFVLINIANGRTSVLPNWKMSRLAGLSPKALSDWMTQQNVTRALLPPALAETLAQSDVTHQLHTVFTGGGPVFPDILDALTVAKSDLKTFCVYGSTEAEPIAHLDASKISNTDRRRMAEGHGLLVGFPVDGLHLKIVNGELLVAGDHVNAGYLDPAHDAENKVKDNGITWHRTGDAGYRDDDGRLWLLGRCGSDVQGLMPFTIEVAARQWDGVMQCALVTFDDIACLVLEGDADHLPQWQQSAARLSITQIKVVSKIPMDRRHASKVDRMALHRILK